MLPALRQSSVIVPEVLPPLGTMTETNEHDVEIARIGETTALQLAHLQAQSQLTQSMRDVLVTAIRSNPKLTHHEVVCGERGLFGRKLFMRYDAW